jgi:ribosomal protein S18 acetylase RimI-like enzyme
MDDKYVVLERTPTKEEYLRLREAVGWWNSDPNAVETGLGNSIFSVCAILEGEVVGIGRVVGDRAIYYYIQDVIVLPGFQGRGIGKSIMDQLMDYIRKHAPEKAFVGLMAARGVSGFYRKYDFCERPAESPGMYKVME